MKPTCATRCVPTIPAMSVFLRSFTYGLPGIGFPGVGDENGACFVVPPGFKQEPQRFGVLVGVQRRFVIVRVRPHPAGVNAKDIQVQIVFETM